MRKQVIDPMDRSAAGAEGGWLDLDGLAAVEVSSEDAAHPIEGALVPGRAETGWRAGTPGPQVVRVRFDQPQALGRIRLRIDEPLAERTQELALRWSPDGGRTFREIVRQRWNFSPGGSTREVEDYRVELPAVTVLELAITPNVAGGPDRATLTEMRLAA